MRQNTFSYIVKADLLEQLTELARYAKDQAFWNALEAKGTPGPTYSYPLLFIMMSSWIEEDCGIEVGTSIFNRWAREIKGSGYGLCLCQYGLDVTETLLAQCRQSREAIALENLFWSWTNSEDTVFGLESVNIGEAMVAAQAYLAESLSLIKGKDAWLLVFCMC